MAPILCFISLSQLSLDLHLEKEEIEAAIILTVLKIPQAVFYPVLLCKAFLFLGKGVWSEVDLAVNSMRYFLGGELILITFYLRIVKSECDWGLSLFLFCSMIFLCTKALRWLESGTFSLKDNVGFIRIFSPFNKSI